MRHGSVHQYDASGAVRPTTTTYGGGMPHRSVIDLHTHSWCSDGTEPPAEVIRRAALAGVGTVALTDHDVTSGWAEADRAGQVHGVVVVPGIEISCSWRYISVHLLAYLPDGEHQALQAELERARESRDTRIQRMVDLLAADGYPVSYEQVLARSPGGASLGRPHVADVLVANGHYPSREAAFADVLATASPYYVSHYAPSPSQAVELVVAAGGAAVMAHPFASRRGRVVPDEVIEDMVEAGMVGLEVDHRDHDRSDREHAAGLVTRLGLVRTGSSDYHGAGKPNRLGENTTAPGELERILAATSGRRLLGA